MHLIKLGDYYVVLDTIAAIGPHEFDESKSTLYLVSGVQLDLDVRVEELLEDIQEAL